MSTADLRAERHQEAMNLIDAACAIGGGHYVRPRAVPGWVFSILPNGLPFGVRVLQHRRTFV